MTPEPKSILITGACGDIGRSIARAFAADGARLALLDLATAETAAPFIEELRGKGAAVLYRSGDITRPEATAELADEARRRFGRLDICIANAGIVERGMLVELSLEAWQRTLDTNLTGSFLTAQAAARVMLAGRTAGHIVFISSWVQDTPRANIGAYCASKGGLKMLARTLALELGPRGVRVNLVAPGWVDAGLTGHNLAAHPEQRAGLERQIPLGRLASADEVARTVRLLCSDDAAYVTGTTLLVDGGSSLNFRA